MFLCGRVSFSRGSIARSGLGGHMVIRGLTFLRSSQTFSPAAAPFASVVAPWYGRRRNFPWPLHFVLLTKLPNPQIPLATHFHVHFVLPLSFLRG